MHSYDRTLGTPVFIDGVKGAAAGMAIGAAIKGIVGAMSQGGAGANDGYGEPKDITDSVQDMGLDLDVDNGVLTGEVSIGCSSGTQAQCSSAVDNMRQINERSDIDIDIQLVESGKASDISLRIDANLSSGGRYSDQYSLLNKSWRWDRAITLNPNTARVNGGLHEFGHAIGLGHQSNSTNSIMSYSGSRVPRLNDSESKRLRGAY